MKLTCTTYKNKNVELKKDEEGKIFMNDIELKDIKSVYFFPCSLTHGDAYLVMHFGIAPKKDNKNVYFFRRNWLNKPIKKNDDDKVVIDQLNKAIMDTYSGIGVNISFNQELSGFEGRVDKTFDMSKTYAIWEDAGKCGVVINPQAKLFMQFKHIDAIFIERLTSYTRSFDLTFVFGDSKLSISTIQRKQYLKYVQQEFKQKEVYETGPDPLPWKDMFKRKKQDDLTWADIHTLLNDQDEASEDESSEWEAGNTEDDEDDEEYEYPDEDEFDENELKDGIYEDNSDTDEDTLIDDEDYDEWENNSSKRKRESIGSSSNKKTRI